MYQLKTFVLWSYHWTRVISIRAIKGFDVLELKHVSLYKGLSDLLIGPGDEQFVVVIGLLRQPSGEINGGFQIHSFPVNVKQAEIIQRSMPIQRFLLHLYVNSKCQKIIIVIIEII